MEKIDGPGIRLLEGFDPVVTLKLKRDLISDPTLGVLNDSQDQLHLTRIIASPLAQEDVLQTRLVATLSAADAHRQGRW